MRTPRFRRVAAVIALAVTMFAVQTKSSGSVWSETVTIVVPYAAGGSSDIAARALASALTGKLAKSVIVENRPGAGGALAVRAVKSAPPDGRTLLLSASITEIQSGKQNPLYDVSSELTPVILCFEGQYVLFITSDLPVRSIQELIAYDKKNPGKLSYGSFGVGSGPHLAFEWLKERTSATMVHVPYRSSLEVINAVLKQDVHLSMDTYKAIAQYVESGKMRPLAATGSSRDKLAPDIPTIDEAGITGFDVTISAGILAPLGTPKEIVATLNNAINDALSDPNVVKTVATFAFHPAGGPSKRYEDDLKRRVGAYRKVISNAGIQF